MTTMVKTKPYPNGIGCESTAFADDGQTVITAPLIGYWAITTGYAEFAGYVGEGTVVGLTQYAGVLLIDHPQQFQGMISLIQPTEPAPLGTFIDLVGLANADGASITGNMLNITAGGVVIDQLRLNVASWLGGMTVAKVGDDINILSGHYTGVANPEQVLLHA